MKRAVLLLAIALAGCQTNARPVEEPPLTECQKAAKALGGPGDPFLKQAVLEKMRNRGCMQ
jgi:hypothetical protein